MVTAEEIAAVPIFAALGEAERERLSRAAADISLVPGEYAAAEGSERALFALLEGRIEAVKLTDGIERVIGERRPGDVFGEVRSRSGRSSQSAFELRKASRVLRLDAHDYHVVAAAAPDVAKEVGRLAAHRIGGVHGLQGIAADPPPPRVIAVGSRSDRAGAGARRFLDRNQITFTWISADAPDAVEAWGGPLPAPDEWPRSERSTADFTRPTHRRVAELRRPDDRAGRDRVRHGHRRRRPGRNGRGRLRRVGGAADDRRRARGPGGQAGTSSRIENYLGFPSGVAGDEPRESRAPAGAKARGRDPGHEVDHGHRSPRAPGAPRRRRPPAGAHDHPRLRRRLAAAGDRRVRPTRRKGISYGAARSEAPATHGLDVHVIGAGNSASRRSSSPPTRAA